MRVILKDLEIMRQVSSRIGVGFGLHGATELQGVIGIIDEDLDTSWGISWPNPNYGSMWTKDFCILLGD